MTDPTPDSLCVCCDAPATHTDHNGHTRCEQHRLPTDDSLAEARRLLKARVWSTGEYLAWVEEHEKAGHIVVCDGEMSAESVARALDERDAKIRDQRKLIMALEAAKREQRERIAELEAEVICQNKLKSRVAELEDAIEKGLG